LERKNNGQTKDNLAFVIGGIFILGLVFATYTYFNKTPSTEDGKTKETAIEKIKEMLSSDTERGEEEVLATEVAEESAEAVMTSTWVATDYKEGDIQKGTYTVKSGDTLWEIAEAVYGNGSQWTEILAANAQDVGYLPDGSQALIFAGQTLTLP
jgi:nucleoid-associated protein YgaU